MANRPERMPPFVPGEGGLTLRTQSKGWDGLRFHPIGLCSGRRLRSAPGAAQGAMARMVGSKGIRGHPRVNFSGVELRNEISPIGIEVGLPHLDEDGLGLVLRLPPVPML